RATNPDDTIALVAHELRHAIEIADASEATDQSGIERLYRRIGRPSGPHAYETDAAIATQRQVRRELSRHR
ncbi:MAG TPA: hypothetical protein VGL62_13865, partial [Vicinamibacterales bacterium]